MQASIIIVLVFAVGIIATTSKNNNYSHLVKHRARPRIARGSLSIRSNPQKNSVFRTSGAAYGFGKRQSAIGSPKINKEEQILSSLLRYFPQGVPADWLLQQMKINPVFAAKLTQLLMDERADLTSMLDRYNPERTTWLY